MGDGKSGNLRLLIYYWDPTVCLTQVHGHKGFQFQNWARTYGCCPEMYYQPTSVEEIKEVSVSLFGVKCLNLGGSEP